MSRFGDYLTELNLTVLNSASQLDLFLTCTSPLKLKRSFLLAHLDHFLHFWKFVHFLGDAILLLKHLVCGLLAYFFGLLGMSTFDVFKHGELVLEHTAAAFDRTALLHIVFSCKFKIQSMLCY